MYLRTNVCVCNAIIPVQGKDCSQKQRCGFSWRPRNEISTRPLRLKTTLPTNQPSFHVKQHPGSPVLNLTSDTPAHTLPDTHACPHLKQPHTSTHTPQTYMFLRHTNNKIYRSYHPNKLVLLIPPQRYILIHFPSVIYLEKLPTPNIIICNPIILLKIQNQPPLTIPKAHNTTFSYHYHH